MVKASALYMVIIIALVIAVICSSLIAGAYFYKLDYQKKFRYDLLENNLNSGISILLNTDDTVYTRWHRISLFSGENDSVALKRINWGIYNIGVVKSFVQNDTLQNIFTIGYAVDSSKWAALYVNDQDRPIAVSGKTTIRGNAFLPKAGVREAYINNERYLGDKRLVIGQVQNSAKDLPPLQAFRIRQLQNYFTDQGEHQSLPVGRDSLSKSFSNETAVYNLKKEVRVLKDISFSGNIVIRSDTTIIIDSTATFHNIQVYARSIIVNANVHGTGQLFAQDSIIIGKHCVLDYPSCLGIVRDKSKRTDSQCRIVVGESSKFSGIIFNYEASGNPVKPSITIGKNAVITGQVYSQGILELNNDSRTIGSVFTTSFLYRNGFTLFENYIINATIDSKALSPYYLTSDLLPVSGKKQKVLQWLETN